MIMEFYCERMDSGSLLIVEHDGRQFAQLIRDEDFQGHYDKPFLFWMAVLGLKYACLGLFKNKQVIDDFSADLECLRRD